MHSLCWEDRLCILRRYGYSLKSDRGGICMIARWVEATGKVGAKGGLGYTGYCTPFCLAC